MQLLKLSTVPIMTKLMSVSRRHFDFPSFQRSMICLVNLSLGAPGPYPGTADAVAIKRVTDAGGTNACSLL